MSKSKNRRKKNKNNNVVENNINVIKEEKELVTSDDKEEVVEKDTLVEEVFEKKDVVVEENKETEEDNIDALEEDIKTIDEIIKEEKEEKKQKIEVPKKKYKESEIEDINRHAQRDLIFEYLPYLIIVFFVVIIRIFIATPVKVNGASMDPTLKDGDVMLLYKLKKEIKGINRFDIVVINTDSGRLIKRVIGLPGDKIKYVVTDGDNKIGKLFVNDKVIKEEFLDDTVKPNTCNGSYPYNICEEEITVEEGSYFVMGDNRGDSKDSRVLGSIPEEKIQGITEIVLFPFDRIGKVN